jgi:predicted  nucleic acid-binding Zn-ribbon protein
MDVAEGIPMCMIFKGFMRNNLGITMKQLPKRSDTREAVRDLTASVKKLSEQIQLQRQEIAELRKPVRVLSSASRAWPNEVSDPLQAEITQIEDRLSVERRMP